MADRGNKTGGYLNRTPPDADCYARSTIAQKLQEQTEQGRARTALFTDIGDTLIAHNLNPRAIADAQRLRRLVDERSWPLITLSGVEFDDVYQRLTETDIAMTCVVVSSSGTAIWVQQTDGTFLKDEVYEGQVRDSGFNRPQVAQKAQALVKDLRPDLKIMFQNPQREAKWQARPSATYWPYKVSLHYLTPPANAEAIAAIFSKQFPKFKIIYCEEINFNAHLPTDAPERMFCLDIVPATPADAINHLIDRLEIRGGFKAGDSGNDAHMLLNADPLTPILVGGYKPEAIATIALRLQEENSKGPVHTLDDGRAIYIENNQKYQAATSLLHAIRLFSNKTA